MSTSPRRLLLGRRVERNTWGRLVSTDPRWTDWRGVLFRLMVPPREVTDSGVVLLRLGAFLGDEVRVSGLLVDVLEGEDLCRVEEGLRVTVGVLLRIELERDEEPKLRRTLRARLLPLEDLELGERLSERELDERLRMLELREPLVERTEGDRDDDREADSREETLDRGERLDPLRELIEREDRLGVDRETLRDEELPLLRCTDRADRASTPVASRPASRITT